MSRYVVTLEQLTNLQLESIAFGKQIIPGQINLEGTALMHDLQMQCMKIEVPDWATHFAEKIDEEEFTYRVKCQEIPK